MLAIQETLRDNEPSQARMPSGVTVIEKRDEAGARLELRAPDGALVLEYRPAEGLCRLHAPRVEIEADGDLRLAGRCVAIEGRERAWTARELEAL
ncbi:MAG: hypothetical protein K8H88_32285, partial [Sandaracinaceae bacterium]|nr:hypothetical protein [Sandaracinaceae bacterium]